MGDDVEWGPWIEHDGNHQPIGMYVQAEHDRIIQKWSGPSGAIINGKMVEYMVQSKKSRSWFWIDNFTKVIRYRIRKPKGLTLLQDILREVERADELV